MKRICIVLAALFASANAWSLGYFADIEVLDRDTGATLPVYRAHGEFWVAGTPGARYAVLIRNLRGERLLAVTSIDGVNVISGETAAWNQTGYVFQPGQAYTIDGWRKSNREVADFTFTALPDSYAARTGRAGNVGVIGVALFLERRPVAERYSPPTIAPPDSPLASPAPPRARAEDSAAARADSAAAANSAGLSRVAPSAPPGVARNEAKDFAAPAAPKLGTGHGPREFSYVSNTDFERQSDRPNETVRIRYDRYENLVAMGIVRPRSWLPPAPNAFPDSGSSFVPDPPGGMQ
jgi:hypothetical protein